MFGGHYHKWLLVTPSGINDWAGEDTITLPPDQRFFIVIHALCRGHYAVLDTNSLELRPLTVNAETSQPDRTKEPT